MPSTLAILLLFQCLGEGVVFVLKLPVPGPVLGMVLLFVPAGAGIVGPNGVLTAVLAPWLVPVVLRFFG